MTEVHGHLIGDEWTGGDVAPTANPSDLSDVVGFYAQADATQAETAIGAAADAFPAWSRSSPQVRFDLLDRVGSLILERREPLGRLLAREEGKTLAEAIGETTRAGQIFKFFAGRGT